MRLILLALFLTACGGYAIVDPAQTERVYQVEHGETSQLAAFDQIDEWVALSWRSAQDVVQTKNERTGTVVVKWITPATQAGTPKRVHSTALIKVTDTTATFTLLASPSAQDKAIIASVVAQVYREWDTLLASTPWGPAQITKAGYVPPK